MEFIKPSSKIEFLKLYIVKYNYLILNYILNIIHKMLFTSFDKFKIRKILVYRIGAFGDSITALPALNEIKNKFKFADIDILSDAKLDNPVNLNRVISKELYNEYIDYSKYSMHDLRRLLKKNKYDLFIELPNNLTTIWRAIRNMIFVKSLNIKHAFGWQISNSKLFKKIQEKYVKFDTESVRLIKIINANFKNSARSLIFDLNILPEDISKINNILYQNNLRNKKLNVAIIIGAKRQQNRWPIDYFFQIIKYLNDINYNVILIGGKEDEVLLKNVNYKNDKYFDFLGKFSPMENAVILNNCNLTISNDTGPMHLAYAVGSKVIAIFSSRDFPGKWFPPQNLWKVFRSEDIPCSICLSENCSDNKCMKLITPNEVIDYIEQNILNK